MKVFLLLILLLASTTQAAQATEVQDLDQQPAVTTTDYYTVRELPKLFTSSEKLQEPLELIKSATETIVRTSASLLDWVLRKNMPTPADAYQRLFHFGRWINDPTDDSCMNTRAKVLVRDSEDEVVFKNERGCAVAAGRWSDPYAGQELTDSRDIQIDHVVPLKHAYVSGAWKWDYSARCLYGNFLGSKYHLMSVSGHENMSKGDRSPDRYMPPSQAYRCEYLRVWLKIKATWKLSISVPEAEAIQNLMEENNCSRSDMVIGTSELRELRTFIVNNINYCSLNKR